MTRWRLSRFHHYVGCCALCPVTRQRDFHSKRERNKHEIILCSRFFGGSLRSRARHVTGNSELFSSDEATWSNFRTHYVIEVRITSRNTEPRVWFSYGDLKQSTHSDIQKKPLCITNMPKTTLYNTYMHTYIYIQAHKARLGVNFSIFLALLL